MIADAQLMEIIVSQVKQLSPDDRIRLIQRITETLISPSSQSQPRYIQFGEFEGNEAAMSTLEDFAIAEWRPTDEELNGF